MAATRARAGKGVSGLAGLELHGRIPGSGDGPRGNTRQITAPVGPGDCRIIRPDEEEVATLRDGFPERIARLRRFGLRCSAAAVLLRCCCSVAVLGVHRQDIGKWEIAPTDVRVHLAQVVSSLPVSGSGGILG
ncbi:hypothetical protein BO70DRAFT_348581 [Aspergillus heteromorphus CBS 117.55]|uniref:Uncharacterized protein n=1 Tax=Aspergillus heteromorphus CBS 117.55 TaxID=1448321 RepID=A0A317X200_9EURO|nr:uncharacterized protein BO70DRAFT_348581 [Aspergillus heteromorphus CBS 117.55]PWY92161.1 hypothetical protein BO70DRAFT_348581 [Aspergillus heteromorphus CBS 117.55]